MNNQIYIDSSCPEINKGKEPLKFEESYFKNYQEKYIETHFGFENLKKEDFAKIFTIRNIDFFKYIGDTNSKYLTFHKLSLSNLNKY